MRKKVMAVVVAVLAFSLIAASAATLGGITSETVGADVGVVASCDTDGVGASFETAYVGNNYVVTGVTITGIDAACDGLDIDVTVSNNSGSVNDSNGGTVAGTSVTLSLAGAVTAEQLTRVAVVIG